MRKSVLMIPLLSLWAVIAVGEPQRGLDPSQVQYFAQKAKLASQGNVAAEECLSWLYGTGFGTARDMDKMIQWASTAAKAGSDAGKLDMAKFYAWGFGVKADPHKAFSMTQELAAKGYPPAESALGILYITGTGVAEDKAESVRWLTKGAEAGDFEGEVRLGGFYHWGDDVKANPAEAKKWLDKAAQHQSDCAVEYFFQMRFLVNAYFDPKSVNAKDVHERIGIKFTNADGKATDIVVFQPSGNQKFDDAWVQAARVAKLPPWPKDLHTLDRVSGFWIDGTDDGFTASIKAAINDVKQFPKDVLLNGSKGDGLVTVSFSYVDGVASNAKITKSSGDSSEDAAALAAVANAKYPATPEKYSHVVFPMSININFGVMTPTNPTAVAVPAASTKK